MDAQQLVTLLKSGDTAPLKFLFEEYGGYCQRLLRQQTGCSAEEASDVLTDALLVFRRNAIEEKVLVVNHPKTYLYTICYYLYRARVRQQGQRAKHYEEIARISDIRQDAHEELETEVAQQVVRQQALTAFQRLGERCRQLLHDFYVDGKSLQEIAQQRQAESTNAVKNARYRCFERWMNHWEEIKNETRSTTYRP